jgi:putative hydrolase of the HAD superfamily
MEIKAIIFDMGRVLVNLDVRKGIFGLFAEDGSDKAVQRLLDEPVIKEYNQGIYNPEEFYKKLKSLLKANITFEEFAFRWCNIFSEMAGMYELVESLSRKYPLGLLSDTDPLHWKFLKENYEVLKFFKNPVLSYQVGKTKPSIEIYKIAAQSVQTPAESCLYIDDLPRNVEAAKSIGMQGIKFTSTEKLALELHELALL